MNEETKNNPLQEDCTPPKPMEGAAVAGPPSGEPVVVPWTADQVREVLRGVYDPEIHMNIIDLGLVYGIDVKGDAVHVRMSLTSPGCPYGPYLIHQVKDTVQALKGITSADVEVVWDPPWGPMMMTEEARLELGFDV
jgi:metal-sulfur cluster biosynthetic enzyme